MLSFLYSFLTLYLLHSLSNLRTHTHTHQISKSVIIQTKLRFEIAKRTSNYTRLKMYISE